MIQSVTADASMMAHVVSACCICNAMLAGSADPCCRILFRLDHDELRVAATIDQENDALTSGFANQLLIIGNGIYRMPIHLLDHVSALQPGIGGRRTFGNVCYDDTLYL